LSVRDTKKFKPLIYLGWTLISEPGWWQGVEIFISVLGGKLIYIYLYKFSSFCTEQRESLVDILTVTGYVLYEGGFVIRFSEGARNVYCPKGLDQLWGSSSPHLDGYLTLVRRMQSGRTINLTGHRKLIARFRINASQTPFTHRPS